MYALSGVFTFKYGISTSILNIRRKETIVDAALFAIRNDFEHIEIINDGIYHTLLVPDEHVEKVRNLCRKHKIGISIHAPFYSIDLASLSERMRKFAIEELVNSLHFAKTINAEWVTIHLGFKFYPAKALWRKAYKKLKKSIEEVLRVAKDLDIKLSMELRSGCFDLGHPTLLERILKDLNNDDYLYVTIDTVQAVGFPIMSMKDIIGKFSDKIISFHIRDLNPAISKDMLACGEGIIDWDTFVDILLKLNIKAPLIFEVSDKEGALMSREYLENLVYSKLQPETTEEEYPQEIGVEA